MDSAPTAPLVLSPVLIATVPDVPLAEAAVLTEVLTFAAVATARAVVATVALPAVKPVAVPVQLVKTPLVGVPSKGVASVGDVANTSDPVPVSSVTAASRFALEGVARKVETPVPKPVTPPTATDGVAHAASVVLDAVRTCPEVGAVAADTATVVVAVFKPLLTPAVTANVAFPAVSPAAVPVMLVPTRAEGVPSTS